MEHVSITNSLQLQQFRQRLCESDQLSGRPIGHMVRTLTMEGLGGDADDTEVWDDRSMDAISIDWKLDNQSSGSSLPGDHCHDLDVPQC
jgi:hypothetical protein